MQKNNNEIVVYHNDFNKIKLPSFNEQEQNLLFFIFTKIKDMGVDNTIRLTSQDLQINERLTNSWQYLTDTMDSLKYKFFKADFKQIIETETTYTERIVNLFQEMRIHYRKRNIDNGYDTSKLFDCIDLALNPEFAYLINQLTSNFTSFELIEFIALNGKYTKTLYRLLKQYKKSGWLEMEWSEFARIMDIPENYLMSDIDKRILKPAIKQLSQDLNLFDQKRTPFKNLAYEKIKEKTSRGRGGKVIGIRFTFRKENEIEQENKYLLGGRTSKKMSLEQAKHNLLGQKFKYQNKIWKVSDFGFDDEKNRPYVTCYRLERDNNERLVEREGQSFHFESEAMMIDEIGKRLC